MSDTSKLAKNTLIYAMGDIIPKLLNLITFPILTHHLTTGEYGIANYVNSIETLLTILTFLGLKTYYLVYYFKVGDEAEQKKLLGNLTIVVFFFNLLLCTALMIVGGNIFSAIGSGVDFYPYIALGVLSNFFSIFSTLPSALYRVRENPMPLTILNVIRGVLIMVATIILIPTHPTSEMVLTIKLVVNFTFAIFFFYITCSNAIFKLNFQQLKHAFIFSLPLVPGDVAYYFSTMSDRILIEKYLSVSELGLYSTATTLAGMLNILAYGAYRAIEPYFFKNYGQPLFNESFRKIRDVLLFVVLLGALGMSLFSQLFIEIMTSEAYHSSYLLVSPLCIGITFCALSLMYSTVMTAQSKTKLNGTICVLCAIISVGLNVLLLPLIGLWAAVIVNVLVYLVNYLFCRHFAGLHIKSSYCIIPFILYSFVCMLFVYLWHPSIIIDIFTKIVVLIAFAFISIKVMGIKLDFIYEIIPYTKRKKRSS